MDNQSTRTHDRPLEETVQQCLVKLETVYLSVGMYGKESDAAALNEIILELRKAVPTEGPAQRTPSDFVVNGTFKVSRQQVANTLWHAFNHHLPWFKIEKKVPPPPPLRFRSLDQTNPGIIDCPLNDGGAVILTTLGAITREFDLRLDTIVAGLEVLAAKYPR